MQNYPQFVMGLEKRAAAVLGPALTAATTSTSSERREKGPTMG